jgi:Na+/proline symporter
MIGQLLWVAIAISEVFRPLPNPYASGAKLVLSGRITSAIVTAFGTAAAFYPQGIAVVLRLVIAIGTEARASAGLGWRWRQAGLTYNSSANRYAQRPDRGEGSAK